MLLIPVSITLQPTRATEDADAKVPTETGNGDTTTITFIWTLAQSSTSTLLSTKPSYLQGISLFAPLPVM